MTVKKLPIDALEECSRVNVRAKVNASIVSEYADSYKAGAIFPPLIVFRERGCERYVVSDGHHRLAAAKKAGLNEIEVDLRDGDETDALKFALSANVSHGLRMSRPDLLKAVGQLMSNKRLSDEYRTHRERSELLRISERYFQSLLADWRSSKGGSQAERRAKANAQEKAAKHTPVAPKSEPKPNGAARSQESAPVTPEQKEVAKQVRESRKRETSKPKPKATVSAAQKKTFVRLVECSKELPSPEDLVSSGASIPWGDIERLHDWTTSLLENR